MALTAEQTWELWREIEKTADHLAKTCRSREELAAQCEAIRNTFLGYGLSVSGTYAIALYVAQKVEAEQISFTLKPAWARHDKRKGA